VDLSKLTQSDKVIGISGILLLIFSFFPWYGIDTAFGNYNRNGWDYFLFGTLPVLLAIAIVVLIALQRFSDVKLPDLPIPWTQAYLIGAGIAAALILLKLLIGDDVANVDLDRKFGLFLALLAALGLVAGCVLKSREPASDTDAPPAPPAV
jgi:peptidoglycan biosynthesis protein MviN/MurJ (putative lipid II flippase)